MNFKEFIKNEGLKKLALARLKSSSYSILIYLFNEILSGMEEIIASRKELSLLLGQSEKLIHEGLRELQLYHMIILTEVPGKPLRIRAQLNLNSWKITSTESSTKENNKKYPLGDAKNLHSIHSTENQTSKNNIKLIDINVFGDPIPFPKNKILSLKALKKEGKNKSKEVEHTLNDLGAFREKNEEIDGKIKSLALDELDTIKHEKRLITQDEELLLQILSQHHQPRKQLIIALRSNLIYPNLKFFLANAKLYANIKDPNKKD